MGSRALLVLAPAFLSESILLNHISRSGFHQLLRQKEKRVRVGAIHSNLERPNVTRLADAARISLTPQEVPDPPPYNTILGSIFSSIFFYLFSYKVKIQRNVINII